MITQSYSQLIDINRQQAAKIKALEGRHIDLVTQLRECRDYIDELEKELDGEDDEANWE